MSHLYAADGDEGTYLFDVSTSAAMAEASAEAESERLRWLDEWMSWARHCPTGYTVIDRRRIEPGDANIYRHDLRYQVECTQPPAP